MTTRMASSAGGKQILDSSLHHFFEKIFQAPSTVLPDRLALDRVPAKIETVPASDPYTIPDAARPVEVYPIPNNHAEDMVLIYVPHAGVVFVSDLYSPNPNALSAGAGGQPLNDFFATQGLDVAIVAEGHGATISFDRFKTLMEHCILGHFLI